MADYTAFVEAGTALEALRRKQSAPRTPWVSNYVKLVYYVNSHHSQRAVLPIGNLKRFPANKAAHPIISMNIHPQM